MLQNYDNIEVIVVDDCSTDNSRRIIESFKDSRIKPIFLMANEGYSHAKNVGIRQAMGKWIVHIDADDMLTQNSITARMEVAEAYPEAEIIHGYALKVQGDVSYQWCVDNKNKLERHPSRLHAQGFMIRKSVFEQHGLYYEKLRSKGDKEYWYRIGIHDESPLKKIVNLRRCHEDVAFYRRHPGAMHKMRKENPKYDAEINRLFNERISVLKKEGTTKGNTPWLA
jgi:glycosyltransferase involved in cell wall biosynthesis